MSLVMITGMLVLPTILSDPAGAVHDLGLFELEGDAVDDGGEPGDDWNGLFEDANADPAIDPPGGSEAYAFIDDRNEIDTTFFMGGGSKDTNPISQWKHSDNDTTPVKNEIEHAYAAAYRDGTDLVIYFGADRLEAGSGDAQLGFWFLQEDVSLADDGTFNGEHVNGDTLVQVDFVSGGSAAEVGVFEWDNGLVQVATANTGDCNDADLSGDDACATTNPGSIGVAWKGDDIPTLGFFEGGINVTELFPGDEQCFASFIAETRSSHSFSAQLKDFALGDFQACVPDTDLSLQSFSTDGGTTSNTTFPDDDGTTDATEIVASSSQTVSLVFGETNTGNIALEKPDTDGDLDQDADDVYVVQDGTNNDCSTLTDVDDDSDGFNDGDVGLDGIADTADDGEENGLLDPGETWLYTCDITGSSGDTKTTTVIGHGIFDDTDVTFCSDPSDPSTGTAISPATTVTCDSDEIAEVVVDFVNPSTAMKIGFSLTMTLTETNDGDTPLTEPSTNVTNFVSSLNTDCTLADVDDDSDGFNDGDVGLDGTADTDDDGEENGILDPGETFAWTCTFTLSPIDDSASTTSWVFDFIGHGLFTTSDGTTFDVSKCNDSDIDDDNTNDSEPVQPVNKTSDPADGTVSTLCDGDEFRSLSISID